MKGNWYTRSSILLAVMLVAAPAASLQSFAIEEKLEAVDAQKRALSEPVWNLFYAIKNSLDYGVIEDIEGVRQPEKDLRSYKRVTQEMITDFEESFSVVSYSVNGEDYELVVESDTEPTSKFKATRKSIFVWKGDRWERLGGYFYL